ncbi:serine hydrolase domain-containing protein [Enterococcus sp. LJL128]|uniref:serine hydrolase domain-containing protein n=1 Tax=Enterococcus sp. LJL51 TaxID=3416656 RepID=UPI003CE9344A
MYEQTKNCINSFLKEGVFPGVSYSFIRNGSIESQTLGFARLLPEKEKLTTDHLFDVASLTKVICTTTVILQLLEEKLIALDQPLKMYYPVFTDDKITIRHLLTHTSDIHTYIKNRDSLSQKELIEAYNNVESGSKLGKEVKYTDVGTILLGLMLEHLLKKTAVELFEERVLRPLQMTSSCFLPAASVKTVATEDHPVRGIIQGATHDPKAFVLSEHAGNAGLFTNLSDLLSFAEMYLNDGSYNGKTFLKKETIQGLLKDYTLAATGERSLGWDLKEGLNGERFLFHTGYTGTFLLLDILHKEAFLFLSNRVHPADNRQAYIEKRDELLQIYLEEKARMS